MTAPTQPEACWFPLPGGGASHSRAACRGHRWAYIPPKTQEGIFLDLRGDWGHRGPGQALEARKGPRRASVTTGATT